MTTPFDQIAPAYAQLWSETPEGRAQREQVWREVDGLFRPGDRVLDLGCGTGDDAVHLSQSGIQTVGIDSSAAMAAQARHRGVDARHMHIEELVTFHERFQGAISNFGALNCVEDLSLLAKDLDRLVAGPLVFCVLSRFYAKEWFTHPRRAAKRLSGRATWRGLQVFYRSPKEIAASFTPYFDLARTTSIGSGDHTLLRFERRPA